MKPNWPVNGEVMNNMRSKGIARQELVRKLGSLLDVMKGRRAYADAIDPDHRWERYFRYVNQWIELCLSEVNNGR